MLYAEAVLNALVVMKNRRSSNRLVVGLVKRLMTATLWEELEPLVEKYCAHYTFIPLLEFDYSKRLLNVPVKHSDTKKEAGSRLQPGRFT